MCIFSNSKMTGEEDDLSYQHLSDSVKNLEQRRASRSPMAAFQFSLSNSYKGGQFSKEYHAAVTYVVKQYPGHSGKSRVQVFSLYTNIMQQVGTIRRVNTVSDSLRRSRRYLKSLQTNVSRVWRKVCPHDTVYRRNILQGIQHLVQDTGLHCVPQTLIGTVLADKAPAVTVRTILRNKVLADWGHSENITFAFPKGLRSRLIISDPKSFQVGYNWFTTNLVIHLYRL